MPLVSCHHLCYPQDRPIYQTSSFTACCFLLHACHRLFHIFIQLHQKANGSGFLAEVVQQFAQHSLNFSVLSTTSFFTNNRGESTTPNNNIVCKFTWYSGANVCTEVDSRRFQIYNVLCKHERSLPLTILCIWRHIKSF